MKDFNNLLLGIACFAILIYMFADGKEYINNKITHWKRMDLIKEKEELVKLKNTIEIENTLNLADSLSYAIDNELN